MTMRAVVHDRYGPPDVLSLREVPDPVPGRRQIRIAVHATTVNRTDTGFLHADPFIVRPFSGLVRPRRHVLGTEFAGVVDAVGPEVERFVVGDRVFGVNSDRFGAHAELLCMDADRPVAALPEEVRFEDAAAVCDGGILALTYLRASGVGPGTRLLVYGASGSIGSAAVQLANHLGAEVTAACRTHGLEVVGSLAPSAVIDCDREDITLQGSTWDVVFDAVGKLSLGRCRGALGEHGTYTSTDLGPWQQNPVLAVWTRWVGPHRVLFPLPRYTREDVELLGRLLTAGELRAVIDRRFPLDDAVDAFRYVDTQQKVGNVVLIVRAEAPTPSEASGAAPDPS